MRTLFLALALSLSAPVLAQAPLEAALPEIRKGFQDWMLDNRVPGLAFGIVKDGKLLHVEGIGVQDLETRRPVTADSAFRIASMSKAFTAYGILSLAAEGKLRLDDPAAKHVPEMAGWASGITVGDLLHHTAGFVTDDPWGDRQQVLTEAEFTAKLKAGVPFSTAPGTAYEYSNFGYAALGRIIGNVSGKSYQQRIGETVFTPLGMGATSYDVFRVPRERLAVGYRFENGRWTPEPMMRDGAFGAMGGVVTTAGDYAKWVAHLLSGWPVPAKAGADGEVLRAMRMGGGFTHSRQRPGKDAADCRLQMIYAGGLVAGQDCLLGGVMFHSGGYPGYGSHMLLFPDAGVGIFAFSNRTYAAPLPPVWDAAGALQRAGLLTARPVPVSPALEAGYAAAKKAWEAGRIDVQPEYLAMNMLLDSSAENWAAEFKRLKGETGKCDTSAPIAASNALSGRFQWRCESGRMNGQLLLAPTGSVQIQALRLSQAGR
ncbi:beta-lactamase family protein [Sandaracinobacter sp. RS1-74]|uniref:serine hydrolase domain-containing protein n=1 Tax=Sandaracinobacteroides sayramensis TaxID=2913411 RepID=UPI001EDC32F7|nr:serine hydrolase domain-containing protein [Sandaracinobacteroides sayramensis]MCG2839410.1 beta-lactamase family protein [Sandaracinobacteroides sayramensis]